MVGDFERHLARLPARRTAAGGVPRRHDRQPRPRRARARFLTSLAATLAPGDGLLLGTDLVKDSARSVAAYDDAAGVTAEFNRNVLQWSTASSTPTSTSTRFEHVARFDSDDEWIEMRLRSLGDSSSSWSARLELDGRFAEGEEMRTEISAKFRRESVEAELAAAGLESTGGGPIPPATSPSARPPLSHDR